MTRDIQQVAESMSTHDDTPEGVAVLVLTTDERTARVVGPMVAKRLYPTRFFGRVLHVEWGGSGYEVVVEALSAPPTISRVQNNR